MTQTLSQSTVESTARSATRQRIVLVTGAGRRVGCVIALALARHGWGVAVHCRRSRTEADAMIAEITAMGRRAAVLQADLSDEAAAGRLVADCSAVLGTPTCLVNNASPFQHDVATSFSYASLDMHTCTNVAASLLLSRELHRALAADGVEHCGVIINLLDQKLDNPNPDFLSYTLPKAALSTATMQLAQALVPALRVVDMAPGIMMVSGDQSQGGFARTHQMTPLGQLSTPEDTAEAVYYLATARTVTGTTLLVDRGQHLMPLVRDAMLLVE